MKESKPLMFIETVSDIRNTKNTQMTYKSDNSHTNNNINSKIDYLVDLYCNNSVVIATISTNKEEVDGIILSRSKDFIEVKVNGEKQIIKINDIKYIEIVKI